MTFHSEEYPHTSRFFSRSYTPTPSAQYTSSRVPSEESVPICLDISHLFLADWINRESQVTVTTYGEHFLLIVLRTWMPYARSSPQSSTSVRRLTIFIADVSTPNELFLQLAAGLPHPEVPHIVAHVQQCNRVRQNASLSLYKNTPMLISAGTVHRKVYVKRGLAQLLLKKSRQYM